jgi:hypothetical protein
MAAPDDRRARVAQRGDQAGGLRVVDDDDVAVVHAGDDRLGVLCQRLLVDRPRRIVERPAVAERAVEAVVDALRDGEELGVSVDDEPARVDAGAAGVGDEGLQQLHHAAAPGRRVDVPHHAAGQLGASLVAHTRELLEAIGRKHRAKALRIDR